MSPSMTLLGYLFVIIVSGLIAIFIIRAYFRIKKRKNNSNHREDAAQKVKLTTIRESMLIHVWTPAIFYLVAFGITEFIIYHISAAGGVILYFAILVGLIISAAVDENEDNRKLWLAFGLVPLIRIVSIVVPLAEINVIYWYLIIAVPVVAGMYVVARNLGYNFDNIGINIRKPMFQLIIAISGFGLGAIDYFILKPAAMVEGPMYQLIFPAVVLLICTGLVEELAFRGIIQKAAAALGFWGWLFVAPIYAILQIGSGSILQIFFVFLVSLYFGFIVRKTKSIVGVSLCHGIMNIILFLVLPNLL